MRFLSIFLRVYQRPGNARYKINSWFRFFYHLSALQDLMPWLAKINTDIENSFVSDKVPVKLIGKYVQDRQTALHSVFTPSFVNYYAKDKFPGILHLPVTCKICFRLQNVLFGDVSNSSWVSLLVGLTELIQLIGGGSCSVEGTLYSRTNLET